MLIFIFDSFMTLSSNIAAICSSFPLPRLEVFISFSFSLSFAAPPQSIFLFISSTLVALFIFLLYTPVFLCPLLLSGPLVLVKAKLKSSQSVFAHSRTPKCTSRSGYIRISCVLSVAGKNEQNERDCEGEDRWKRRNLSAGEEERRVLGEPGMEMKEWKIIIIIIRINLHKKLSLIKFIRTHFSGKCCKSPCMEKELPFNLGP